MAAGDGAAHHCHQHSHFDRRLSIRCARWARNSHGDQPGLFSPCYGSMGRFDRYKSNVFYADCPVQHDWLSKRTGITCQTTYTENDKMYGTPNLTTKLQLKHGGLVRLNSGPFRRLRRRSVQNQTRVKNRIKGHLHYYGIPIPSQWQSSYWSGHFINWLRSLAFSQFCGKDYLLFCLEELQQHRKRTVDVTRILRGHLKSYGMYEQVKLLRSIPGIGPIVALSFFTEIMDINRFATFDHLVSFVGLVPSLRDSGEKTTEQGLTQRRNRYLRHLIVEAAWVAIRKDPALLLAFNLLKRRIKKQDAIIRIAKNLLRRIRYVWKNQTPYVPAIVE